LKINLFIFSVFYIIFTSCQSKSEIKNIELIGNEKIIYNERKKIFQINNDYLVINIIPIKDSTITLGFVLELSNKQNEILDNMRIEEGWINNDESGYHESFRLLEYPLISYNEIDENFYLRISQRYHNGNACDGVLIHFVHFDDKKMKYIGSFEKITHLAVEDEFLVRTIDDSIKKVSVYRVKQVSDVLEEPYAKFDVSLTKDTLIFQNLVTKQNLINNSLLIKNECF
jgi:ribonuclease BN (tRNA processing enzyme)